ncbi:MAG: helix-turn-helix domain-containing protein, partial [Patescibacteria group bacterium]
MLSAKILRNLKDIGLTEKEASVYLASLSLGPSTILELAEATSLKRTTVYSVIETLKQRGLMSVELSGWKRRFTAVDPQSLSLVLKQRERGFEAILPELISLHNLKSEGGTFKQYEGLEAVKGVYEQLLKDAPPGCDYLIISDIAS